MKKKRSLLAVALMLCLMITWTAFPTFAASGNYVRVQTTQNYADAQEVLRLINKQRAKRGLKKLKLDKSLTKAAVKRAAELTVYIPEKSPHKRPNGKSSKSVNKKIKYECCAEGYTSPSSVMKGWMSSKPHKKGILLKKARSVGIGCVTSENGVQYWTLEFSNSKAKKKETRRDRVTSAYAIPAKAKYLTRNHFWMGLADEEMYFGDDAPTVFVGDNSTRLGVFYSNNYGYNTLLRGADITWASSDNSVASVDSYGRFIPKATGTVTITARMKDSLGYAFSMKVNVENLEDLDDDYYW